MSFTFTIGINEKMNERVSVKKQVAITDAKMFLLDDLECVVFKQLL